MPWVYCGRGRGRGRYADPYDDDPSDDDDDYSDGDPDDIGGGGRFDDLNEYGYEHRIPVELDALRVLGAFVHLAAAHDPTRTAVAPPVVDLLYALAEWRTPPVHRSGMAALRYPTCVSTRPMASVINVGGDSASVWVLNHRFCLCEYMPHERTPRPANKPERELPLCAAAGATVRTVVVHPVVDNALLEDALAVPTVRRVIVRVIDSLPPVLARIPSTHIVELCVAMCAFDDNAAAAVTACPTLEVLDASFTAITDAGVAALRVLPALRRLSLFPAMRVTGEGFASWPTDGALRALAIRGPVTRAGVAAVAGLHSVTWLSIVVCVHNPTRIINGYGFLANGMRVAKCFHRDMYEMQQPIATSSPGLPRRELFGLAQMPRLRFLSLSDEMFDAACPTHQPMSEQIRAFLTRLSAVQTPPASWLFCQAADYM